MLDSRESVNAIRRRRVCVACGLRWTTLELHSDDIAEDVDRRAIDRLAEVIRALKRRKRRKAVTNDQAAD